MIKRNVIRVTKLKSRYKSRILMIILWIFIGFLIIRGVGTLIRGNSINLKPFREEITRKLDNTNIESNGVAFAENFVVDYLSYTGDDKDYYKRLFQYTDLDFSNTKLKKMDVVYVNKIRSEWKNDKLLIVDLKAKVAEIPDMENFLDKYMIPSPIITNKLQPTPVKSIKKSPVAQSLNEKPRFRLLSNTENTEEEIKDTTSVLYIRIPVSFTEGQFKISGYPTFISSPSSGKKENKEVRTIQGEDIKDKKDIEEIKKLVISFISSYYKGNETELSYFMKNKDNVSCLNGEYEIVGIPTIEMKELDDKYYARIYYQVNCNGNTFDNGMEFRIVREDDKLLIEEYNTAIN